LNRHFHEILKLPFYVLSTILYAVSFIIPKDKKLWLFGSWEGEKYSDNSKYFFEYIRNEHKEVNAVWITKSKSIYNYLKSRNIPAERYTSLKGMILHLRAGVVVLTKGKKDVNHYLLTKNTKTIQLWHGVGYKKILFDTDLKNIYNKYIKNLYVFPVLKNFLRYDLLISTSDLMKKRFSGSFNMNIKNIPVTGYPRNDIFFRDTMDKRAGSKVKTILYAPTLRNEGIGSNTVGNLKKVEIEKLNSLLADNNTVMYVKLHFSEEDQIGDIDLSNIKLLKSDPFFDIQEFLCKTDILITDYSSIYFDFLLLDRPVIFFAYDLDDYIKNDRGLYEKYEDVTPGDMVRSWDEVICSVQKNLENPDRFKEERKKLKEKYWEYFDGKSSERVYNEIMKIL